MGRRLVAAFAIAFVILAIFGLSAYSVYLSGEEVFEREVRWNSAAISAGQNRQALVKQQQEIERLELEVLRLEGIMNCFLNHFEECKRLQGGKQK